MRPTSCSASVIRPLGVGAGGDRQQPHDQAPASPGGQDAGDQPEVTARRRRAYGPEIAEVFAHATGIPAHYEQQPIEAIRSFSDDVVLMFEWLDEFGYQADIAALRARHPALRTLRRWLHETNWQPAVPA
jgi:hypothetical protein